MSHMTRIPVRVFDRAVGAGLFLCRACTHRLRPCLDRRHRRAEPRLPGPEARCCRRTAMAEQYQLRCLVGPKSDIYFLVVRLAPCLCHAPVPEQMQGASSRMDETTEGKS